MIGILRIQLLLLLLVAVVSAPVFAACPPLADYYPQTPQQWPEKTGQIRFLMEQCLDSAEYFALLGAAEMNTGHLAEALEALERSLLLDSQYGAAQVDYAQALYQNGQLFAALELNATVLARPDLPASLQTMLQQRAREWRKINRSSTLIGEVSAGYDTNLNGAPSNRDLVLTLSGESVTLRLGPQFQPAEGAFVNFRLAGNTSQMGLNSRHDLVYAFRNRSSTDSQSDINQFDWRYGYTRAMEKFDLEFSSGTSHLLYGGSPLYSVYEARSRIKAQGTGCVPLTELAAQYQNYHGQSQVSGLEAGLSAGFECSDSEGLSKLGFEGGYLFNKANDARRPGGDRRGWRAQIRWDRRTGPGMISMTGAFAQLDDARGYSELIAQGAKRDILNRTIRVQYSQLLAAKVQVSTSMSHQAQSSNLDPFENSGTMLDIGFQYQFK